MQNLVSIIMNCKNGQKYLSEALQSILEQTYTNWELIFVDNNSQDNSKNIFLNYTDKRFKYFYLERSVSLGTARQYAYQQCNGKFIAFLDTDDLWLSTKLEKQISLFVNSRTGLVITNSLYFSHNKEKIFYKKKPNTGYVFYQLLENYNISLETLVCKKKFLDEISFKFNKKYSMISDYELCIRLSAVSNLDYYDEVLAKCRIHSDSESSKNSFLTHNEKISFVENLSNEDYGQKYEKFFFYKKKLLHKIEVSKIIDNIENGTKKVDIIKNLKKNSLFFDFVVFWLLITPFSKYLIKYYRYFFTVRN